MLDLGGFKMYFDFTGGFLEGLLGGWNEIFFLPGLR